MMHRSKFAESLFLDNIAKLMVQVEESSHEALASKEDGSNTNQKGKWHLIALSLSLKIRI